MTQTSRLRRDPRALRQSQPGRDGRPRISPRGNAMAAAPVGSAASQARELPLKRIESPNYLILAVLDAPDHRLSTHDVDVLAVARSLADAGGGAVLALCFGEVKGELSLCGIDRLLIAPNELIAAYCPDKQARFVEQVIDQLQPKHTVFPESALGGADLGRRVAALIGVYPATQAWRIDENTTTCRVRGGVNDLTRPTPEIILVLEEAAEPVHDMRFEAIPVAMEAELSSSRIEDLGMLEVDPESVPLAEADFIVSAGNGVHKWDDFHQLAKTLRAAKGGSRVAVDNGFLPRSRQIGATGTLVSARYYLALGISGAPQHLQGISACEHVIAVNTDEGSNMVQRANLSVIADAEVVMPALVDCIKRKKVEP